MVIILEANQKPTNLITKRLDKMVPKSKWITYLKKNEGTPQKDSQIMKFYSSIGTIPSVVETSPPGTRTMEITYFLAVIKRKSITNVLPY